ncbi:hypothetical protein GQ44DRAFT_772041 [Phaeosphaeriaceae sp. PMI808]|nr:hypothetical protein GQ44DRAFT_772041 [Phaeosphaeriaceae sp. PMI808]
MAAYWSDKYDNAQYEGRDRFDPGFNWDAEEEKRLVRKAWVMFISLDLNRKNINQAISDNMLKELKMNTNDFNYGQTEIKYKRGYPVETPPLPIRKERGPNLVFDRQREHKRIRIDAPGLTTDLYEHYISTDQLYDDEADCDEAIARWLSRYDSRRDLARFALDVCDMAYVG